MPGRVESGAERAREQRRPPSWVDGRRAGAPATRAAGPGGGDKARLNWASRPDSAAWSMAETPRIYHVGHSRDRVRLPICPGRLPSYHKMVGTHSGSAPLRGGQQVPTPHTRAASRNVGRCEGPSFTEYPWHRRIQSSRHSVGFRAGRARRACRQGRMPRRTWPAAHRPVACDNGCFRNLDPWPGAG
jgi:hypothetical protein